MQSKNVLLLGILFVFLLITFCIVKYIDNFHPSLHKVTIPNQEIIDQNFMQETISEKQDTDNYLQVIKLVEKEEKDIQDAYNKALKHQTQNSSKSIKKPKPVKIQKVEKPTIKEPQKITIEAILQSLTLLANHDKRLSNLEKTKLKKLAQNLHKNPSSFLRIEADKKSKKLNLAKKYLTSLGISSSDVQIKNSKSKNIISVLETDQNSIEISIIKKDQ